MRSDGGGKKLALSCPYTHTKALSHWSRLTEIVELTILGIVLLKELYTRGSERVTKLSDATASASIGLR
jgi:hypothetical protein